MITFEPLNRFLHTLYQIKALDLMLRFERSKLLENDAKAKQNEALRQNEAVWQLCAKPQGGNGKEHSYEVSSLKHEN